MLTQVPVKQTPASAVPRPAFNNVFGALQREIDRVFDEFTPALFASRNLRDVTCRMDLAETKGGLELTVELPGLEQKDVEVSVSDGVLTVSGEKKFETEESDKNYRVVERGYGSFSRSIELPKGVNADQIRASLEKGVLRIIVPTPAKPEAKKIVVKAVA